MPDQKRYHWLDWLRFAAAFAVLVCHARGGNWVAWGNLDGAYQNRLSWIFFALTRPGLEAVIVFFVLSGFLVGGKVIERALHGNFDFRTYALDRISRIYVPLLPALLLSAVVALVLGHQISFLRLIGNIFALQGLYCDSFAGNAPLWSLAYEIWFYVLGGFAALCLSSARHLRAFALLGVILALAVFTKLEASLLFCWCLGAFSYALMSRDLRWPWFILGILLTLLGCLFSQLLTDSISVDTKLSGWYVPTRPVAALILSSGLAFVIPFLAQANPRSKSLISIELAGTKLAAFSYTLYLTHYPILELWKSWQPQRFVALDLPAFGWFIARIVSCLLVAWLLYLPFEAQTTKIRDWLRRR